MLPAVPTLILWRLWRLRRLRVVAPAVLLFGLTACLKIPTDLEDPSRMAAAPATAGEVLDRHIQAIGGEQAVRAVLARTVDARMTFLPEEGCEEEDETCLSDAQSGTFVLQSTADGRLYRRTVLGQLIEERGYDGKEGWQVLADGTVRIEAPEEAAISREDARLHWYFDLDAAKVQATLLPARDTDSAEDPWTLDGLRWEVQGSPAPAKTLWFDRSTGLLHEEIIEDGEGETRTRQVILYESYLETGGVQVPERIRLITEAGNHRREVEFFTTSVSHGALDDALFRVPIPQKPDRKPDPRVARLESARAAATESPGDAAVTIVHARAAWANARFAEAVKAARATLELDREEPEAVWTLIRAAVLRGDYKEADKLIARGKKVGIRESELARQQAWIRSHRRDYRGMARALDNAQQPQLAGRYRSFAGKPFDLKMGDDGCTARVPFVQVEPAPAVEIGTGNTRVLALIDTGATDLILDDTLADELNVSIQTRTQLSEGGPEVGHGQLPKLEIGDLTLRNVPVDVFDAAAIASMAGESERGKIRAVIGLRTLERFQVTFDLPHKTLSLVNRSKRCRKALAQNRGGSSIPFWLHETHFLYIGAALNGADGLYLVNTGMRGVAVTATRPAYAYAGIGAPVIRPDKPSFVTVDELRIGEAMTVTEVPGAYGFFEQTETADGFRIDGMLGIGVLGRSRWTIDFDEQRLYFVAMSSPAGKSTTD